MPKEHRSYQTNEKGAQATISPCVCPRLLAAAAFTQPGRAVRMTMTSSACRQVPLPQRVADNRMHLRPGPRSVFPPIPFQKIFCELPFVANASHFERLPSPLSIRPRLTISLVRSPMPTLDRLRPSAFLRCSDAEPEENLSIAVSAIIGAALWWPYYAYDYGELPHSVSARSRNPGQGYLARRHHER
jgi:hypothetical protein